MAKRIASPAPPKSAPAASKHADISPSTIALYVPNLIGYFRLITGIAALYYAPFEKNENKNMSYFLALYFVSYMADALDGTAARALNQTSKFGQVLDMVTDRSCSAGLLCVLSHKFPQHSLLFVLLIGLDMCSHYTSMFAAGLGGSSSHKSAFNEANPLLKFYYGNQKFLFIMCFLNESYFVLLAVKDDADLYTAKSLMGKQFEGALGHALSAFNWLCLAACVLKQVLNLMQWHHAGKNILNIDVALAKEKAGA